MTSNAPTILVIDDHVALAQGFAQVLTAAGYTSLVAFEAEVAFREARLHRPDAIILDFQMPMVNGVGFLYRLRAEEGLSRTPVLVITGHELTEEVQSELRQLGASIRLKPVAMSDLLSETAALIARRRAEPDPAPPEDLDHFPRI